MWKIALFMLICLACSRNEEADGLTQTFEISPGELFMFDIYKGKFSVEGKLVIIRQPEHFVVSEVVNGTYQYQSTNDFAGTENVVIERQWSRGDGEYITSGFYNLNLIVK